MEHRCYQCGAQVEDGIPFCGQCKAPQIRVMGVETPATGEVSAELPPQSPPGHATYPPLRRHSALEWRQALSAAFLGLLLTTILSTLMRGAIGIGLLAAGFLSVYFYRRRNPFTQVTLRLGARLGALSGILGFGITAIATATVIWHSGEQVRAVMLKSVQQYASRSSDPQMRQVLDFYASRQGFILMLGLGSVMMFLLFLVLAIMGGVLAAAVLRRKGQI